MSIKTCFHLFYNYLENDSADSNSFDARIMENKYQRKLYIRLKIFYNNNNVNEKKTNVSESFVFKLKSNNFPNNYLMNFVYMFKHVSHIFLYSKSLNQ